MRVVRRELGVDRLARRERGLRRRKVGHVRMRLAREDRVALEALLLRPLDLAVPVSPLDQTHRYPATDVSGKIGKKTQSVSAAPLVGLQRYTKTVPAIERGIAVHALENECNFYRDDEMQEFIDLVRQARRLANR